MVGTTKPKTIADLKKLLADYPDELTVTVGHSLMWGISFGNYIFNSLDKCEGVKYIQVWSKQQ